MAKVLDELERRIEDLRVEVRRAAKAGDSACVRDLRGELRGVEQAWDDAVTASVDSEPRTVTLRPARCSQCGFRCTKP